MMMMMMMMMIMMNFFCAIVDRRKALSLISSRDLCQRSSPSQICDTLPARFESAQNLISGFVERSCAVVITTACTTAPRHSSFSFSFFFNSFFSLNIIPSITLSKGEQRLCLKLINLDVGQCMGLLMYIKNVLIPVETDYLL